VRIRLVVALLLLDVTLAGGQESVVRRNLAVGTCLGAVNRGLRTRRSRSGTSVSRILTVVRRLQIDVAVGLKGGLVIGVRLSITQLLFDVALTRSLEMVIRRHLAVGAGLGTVRRSLRPSRCCPGTLIRRILTIAGHSQLLFPVELDRRLVMGIGLSVAQIGREVTLLPGSGAIGGCKLAVGRDFRALRSRPGPVLCRVLTVARRLQIPHHVELDRRQVSSVSGSVPHLGGDVTLLRGLSAIVRRNPAISAGLGAVGRDLGAAPRGAGPVSRGMLAVAGRSQIHLPVELDSRLVMRVRRLVAQLRRMVTLLGRLGTIVRGVVPVGGALGAVDRGRRPRRRRPDTVGRRMLTIAGRSQLRLPVEVDRRLVIGDGLFVAQIGRVVALLGHLGTIICDVVAVARALGTVDSNNSPRRRCPNSVGRRMLTIAGGSELGLEVGLDGGIVTRVSRPVTQLGSDISLLRRFGAIISRQHPVAVGLGAVNRGHRPRRGCPDTVGSRLLSAASRQTASGSIKVPRRLCLRVGFAITQVRRNVASVRDSVAVEAVYVTDAPINIRVSVCLGGRIRPMRPCHDRGFHRWPSRTNH
jgi:hypothetical protein